MVSPRQLILPVFSFDCMLFLTDYVKFSSELAHEYVNLGKTGKAASIYAHTWTAINNLRVSEETRVLFLLRYSESLISTGNILKR